MADVLAVFAHPDDETFICGGTLAALSASGKTVSLICATKGEMGRRVGVPPVATRETLPSLRETELRAACSALGVEDVTFLGYRDKTLEIASFPVLVDTLADIYAEHRPQAVITFHERLGGHPDHTTIGRAAKTAFLRYVSASSDSPSLLYVGWPHMAVNPRDYDLAPEEVVEVDVRSHLTQKLAAFRAHKTQSDLNGWLWKNDKEAMRRLAATEVFIRGAGSGGPVISS